MKKLFFGVACLLSCVAVSAQTIEAQCQIQMVARPSGTPDQLYIYQIVEASATSFDNEYESTKLMNTSLPTSINIYAKQSYGTLSDVALPDIKGMPITIQTNASETSYEFNFSDVEGSIQIIDAELDSIFDVVEGGQYKFTTELGKKTMEDRFAIYKPFGGDPGELSVCYQYEKLSILNNPYTQNIVIRNADGEIVKSKMARTTPQIIPLDALPSGQYSVDFGDGAKVMRFSVKPAIQ